MNQSAFLLKTLYIIRHAKSSWDDPGQADFDRPLNIRGERDAPRMGKRLKEKDLVPDLMLSSPAARALSTCKIIADALNYPNEKIQTEMNLYHAVEEQILEQVNSLDDRYNVVFIFGHNPGLTDFVNSLTDNHLLNIPTCGVVACTLNINSWKDADLGKGKMLFFDYPKKD